MTKMAFRYLEIRPCISVDGNVTSYVDEAEFNELVRLHRYKLHPEQSWKAFWTLYGRYIDERGFFLAHAIGDFADKDAARAVLDAINAPLLRWRDALRNADHNLDVEDPSDRMAFVITVAIVQQQLTDFIE